MKNLKLKLTMIVTIIAILMMNMAVYAATDMTTNVTTNNEGKNEVTVVLALNETDLTDADFTLEFNKDLFKFNSSNVKESDLKKDNLTDGKLGVMLGEDFLIAQNYSVTFKFEYIGEEKTSTGTFKFIPTDFVATPESGIPVQLTVETITKDVTIKFEEVVKPSAEPSSKPEETVKPSNTTGDATEGEVNLNDKKPQTLPQAGTNVVPYIVGTLVVLTIAGITIVIKKRK